MARGAARGRRARTPRTVIAIASIMAVALVAAVLLLEFDSPALGQAALARIGSALGGRAEARAFRFRLLRGLALEGLAASSEIAGGRWTLGADALVLDHRLWPLLGGRVEVERIVLRRPHLRLEQRPAGGGTAPRPTALPGAAALALRVVEARMDDGTVEVTAPGQPPLTVADLDFTMRDLALAGATLSGLAARGQARARSIRFARSEARDVEAAFTVQGGALTAERIRFRTSEGRFEGALRARLDRLPLTYSLDLRGDPLDLNAMAGLTHGSFGPARLKLAAEGSGSGASGLRGQGVLRMEPGRVPSSPLLERVQAALGAEGLVGARYEASEAPFRLQDGRVHFDSFPLRADPLSLDLRGWIALDGPLSLSVDVRAPRAMVRVAGAPANVLDALTDPEGQVVVPLTVTGTQREPLVRPDVAALMAQAGRGAAGALARKAGEGLKGLLRRRSP